MRALSVGTLDGISITGRLRILFEMKTAEGSMPKINLDAFFDGFTGAGLFGKLGRPAGKAGRVADDRYMSRAEQNQASVAE